MARSNGLARIITAVLLIVAVLFIVSCSSSDPQNTFAPEGKVSRDIDTLFRPIGWIAIAVFFLVEGALVYLSIRFRRKPGAFPRQSHGSTRLELAWTIAPAILLAAISVPTVATIFNLADTPANALEIKVTGHQWWWEFEYPTEGVLTANELHIPVGRAVHITLQSDDVIHSFWVPKLAGKMDVVPNHNNTMWLNADKPGVYLGQCAEFCGLSHALMRFRVIADTDSDYRAWVDNQKKLASRPSDALAQRGADKFATTCGVCHTVTGTDARGKIGPNLTHFAARDTFPAGLMERTPENIGKWLRNPPGVKPGSKMPNIGLSEDEITALTAYLQTLR